MRKWLLGLLLGGFLGVFDGLSALFSAPETKPEILGIVIGSTFKGIVAGVLIGWFAQRVKSVPWGIAFGLVIGAFLAFLVSLMQYLEKGEGYWLHIMLPGTALGIIVGYATQRYGTTPQPRL
jgi:F0F1-type ATP synthase assembly protein I